jgi:hypothetical protein
VKKRTPGMGTRAAPTFRKASDQHLNKLHLENPQDVSGPSPVAELEAAAMSCAGCLEPARRLRPIVVNGARHMVCDSCRGALRKIRSGRRGQRVEGKFLEPASQSDRAWFENHVGRTHRVRPPIGGEVFGLPRPPAGWRSLLVVRQIRPGVRLKLPFVVPRDGPDPLNSERFAAEVFGSGTASSPKTRELECLLRERIA